MDQYREPIKDESGAESLPRADRAAIGQEILDLEQKLAEKKAEQEKSVEAALGVEIAKPTGPMAAATTQTIAPKPEEIKADAEKFRGAEKSQQLQGLVNLAFEKGAAYATEVVKKLDNPYLLDEFHDVLVDKFREELVKRGKLEEM